ncbi:hypothetical protein HGRIS_005645 [Hohenbuehelia grisea]|uniref:ABC transporter domain-containing protein n=1 Tax=Hohenbuehelia grisea TaxID=104357 RepID=A0ABR3JZR0_9AGAR
MRIEQEPSSDLRPPAYWPTTGNLVVDGLSARYTMDGPTILKNISFRIKSGEHISVVGRTGSGKSSLVLSLLRCIPTEGEVFYDGVSTSKIALDSLRSNITIIPQVPDLLSGTLRQNLDPFSAYDDATLNDALRSAGLFSLQEEPSTSFGAADEGENIPRLALDTVLTNAGGNLSVGQRQIIALARAMLTKDKLLILDEATSAIDHKTDALIQANLRTEFADTTVIAIAHRLKTIIDFDKVMVLEEGQIVEFDTPESLLQKSEGKLRALVDESPDRALLFAMVERRGKFTTEDT